MSTKKEQHKFDKICSMILISIILLIFTYNCNKRGEETQDLQEQVNQLQEQQRQITGVLDRMLMIETLSQVCPSTTTKAGGKQK